MLNSRTIIDELPNQFPTPLAYESSNRFGDQLFTKLFNPLLTELPDQLPLQLSINLPLNDDMIHSIMTA